ncbi:MAG: dephospho-CoA kinase [Proteobacteria bacterium]|nr:dephospho-CoA kinase [Pseudomonadota bacterium]
MSGYLKRDTEVCIGQRAARIEVQCLLKLGDSVFDAEGNLDRSAMRRIIFADPDAKARLESIMHPRIQAVTYERAASAGGRYQIIAVPLLTQSPIRDFVDRVLVVDCDEKTQIRRLVARDNESEGQARRILAAQASRDERLEIADDIIRNDGDLEATLQQVKTLHHRYLAMAGL